MAEREDHTIEDIKATRSARQGVARDLLEATKEQWKLKEKLPWIYDEETGGFSLDLPYGGGTAEYRLHRELRHCTGRCMCSCSCRCVPNEKIVLTANIPDEEPFELVACGSGYSSVHWIWKILYDRLRVKDLRRITSPVQAFVREHEKSK